MRDVTSSLSSPTRSRVLEATRAVNDRLKHRRRLDDVTGFRVDSLKHVSSLTRFERVARSLAGSQGVARCERTLQKVGA